MGWWWTSSESKAESQQPTAKPSQSQPHDADFHEAFPHLAPTNPSSPPSTSKPAASSQASAAAEPIPPYDPSLPTTMSCRAAFDSAFYCSSFGGHFNDIYRYGQLRSCSEHWSDWRFCMSLMSTAPEAKARAIQERYRQKEEKIRNRPSSEDVWERRGPDEMIVGAFGKAEEEARRVEDR